MHGRQASQRCLPPAAAGVCVHRDYTHRNASGASKPSMDRQAEGDEAVDEPPCRGSQWTLSPSFRRCNRLFPICVRGWQNYSVIRCSTDECNLVSARGGQKRNRALWRLPLPQPPHAIPGGHGFSVGVAPAPAGRELHRRQVSARRCNSQQLLAKSEWLLQRNRRWRPLGARGCGRGCPIRFAARPLPCRPPDRGAPGGALCP